MRFLPKDEGFFGLFDQLSAHLITASALLRDLFHDPSRIDELVVKVKAEEHAADKLTYEIMQRIDRSFVTPLDREDIHMLANRLDNVVDLLDGTARRSVMFRINERRQPAIDLMDVLAECARVLAAGVKEIRNSTAVHKAARQVKELEEKADAIYSKAIADLFAGTPDAIEVIKWKEILEHMEAALDRCEDIADVVQGIVIENG